MSLRLLSYSAVLFVVTGILYLLTYYVDLPISLIFFIKVGLIIGGGGLIAIWIFRRILGDDRTDAIIKNLVLLVITLAVMLIVSELAVRIVFREITTTGGGNSYFDRNWYKRNVHLNTWEFREREFKLEKPQGIYRVAVVGDSFTFGQGIPEKDRFTNLLEKNLNELKSGYEVLNFGRCATETTDHVKTLRDVVLKINPDYIILQWYINDFEGHDKSGRPQPRYLLPSFTLRHLFRPNSALYFLIRRQWNSLQELLGISGNYDDYMYKRFSDPKSPNSQDAIHALKNFIVLSKSKEIPLSIVLFPRLSGGLGEKYRYSYLHNYVIEVCAEERINCIDLRSTFDSYIDNKESNKLWVNRFDGHPNSIANRLAADRIMDTFGKVLLSAHH